MNFKSILFHLFAARTVCDFKSTSFCSLIEKECVGSYDSELNYKEICKHVKCQTPYTHQCGVDKCAKSQQECKDLLNVNRYFSSITFKNTIRNALFFNERLKHNMFNVRSYKNRILNCTKSQYKRKTSDVCVSGKNCFVNAKSTAKFSLPIFISYTKNALKNSKCICEGKHTYQCGQDHCSVSKQACVVFSKKSKIKIAAHRSCDNDLTLYEINSNLNDYFKV